MSHQISKFVVLRRQFIALGVSITALFAVGCGHSQAANNSVSMEAVTNAIHGYGQGHSPTQPLPASYKPLDFGSATPTEVPEIVFTPHMKSLLMQEKFDDLEQVEDDARTKKARHSGGGWVAYDFYDAVSSPLTPVPTAAEWEDHLALLNKWVAAKPESATARIALASGYYSRAWAARGNGYANTVDNSAWKIFYQNIALMKSQLLQASKLKDKDPYWYEAMQQVALTEGWDNAQARDLFDQASAFEPTFYTYYREYANYILPRWNGEEGEAQAFAEEMLKRLDEPTASMVYFEIASLVLCGCSGEKTSLDGMSWPKIKEGYGNTVRLYGISNSKMNRFAYMSFIANDRVAAQQVFPEIGDNWDHSAWPGQLKFETARAWALNP